MKNEFSVGNKENNIKSNSQINIISNKENSNNGFTKLINIQLISKLTIFFLNNNNKNDNLIKIGKDVLNNFSDSFISSDEENLINLEKINNDKTKSAKKIIVNNFKIYKGCKEKKSYYTNNKENKDIKEKPPSNK